MEIIYWKFQDFFIYGNEEILESPMNSCCMSGKENTTVHGMLIDGKTVDALGGRRIDVENPANRRIFAQVPRGDKADVDRAVGAASRAF